jgi:hypothetical protein
MGDRLRPIKWESVRLASVMNDTILVNVDGDEFTFAFSSPQAAEFAFRNWLSKAGRASTWKLDPKRREDPL